MQKRFRTWNVKYHGGFIQDSNIQQHNIDVSFDKPSEFSKESFSSSYKFHTSLPVNAKRL